MRFKMRDVIKTAMAVALGACLAILGGATAYAAASQPNVILILADDLGYGELGCYGGPVKTPVMDRLAEDGVRCTNGYAAFPVCSPSRAALMTGRYPARIGPTYEDYYGGGAPGLDPAKHVSIGSLMKEAGYRTACFGKWNVTTKHGPPPNEFGFDRWVGLYLNHDFYTHKLVRTGELDMYKDGEPYPDREGTWCDTVFADEAIKFIEAESDKPFFLYLPFQAPHSPYQDPDKPFDPPQEKNRPTLIKMIERLDLEIGRVLKALDDQRIADNTLVIMTSDNGGAQDVGRNLPLRGAKQLLQEGGIRVPLIFRWPGVLPEGKEFSTPITAMDLTATVAAAGGAKPRSDAPFDGVDLLGALTGKAVLKVDRPLFFRRRVVNLRRNQNFIRQSAVRQGDWKYLRSYKYLGGGKFSGQYKEAIYNLKDDIAEDNNLAETNPEKLKALCNLLEQWEAEMAKTAKPFPQRETQSKRAKPMQVTICPRLVPDLTSGNEEEFMRRVEDLFVDRTDDWKYVSKNISHFKFYSTPLVWITKKKPELLRRVVKSITAMDKGIAVEVGIRHGHTQTEKTILDPITRAGGRVDFIITDNVFIKSQFRKDKKDQYNWTYEQAVEKYAEYVAGIKKKYPKLKVGILEAGFRFHWEDKTQFPAENPAKDYGDLKMILTDVIAACEARGTLIDIFQPEYSYERIENTKNGWEKLKAMETFCREEGIEFYFLFNDHTGGHASDKLFHDNVMKCLRSVKSHGLTPELGTIQSWYKHPLKDLPEDQPYTFMYLANEFIQESQKMVNSASKVVAIEGENEVRGN